jgi:hypothetical protein
VGGAASAIKENKRHKVSEMSEAALSVLDGRVTQLESALNQSLVRIEGLIRQEIQDLKTEQLSEIKKSLDRIERESSKTTDRLADDQRRLWEAVRALEGRENLRTGGNRAFVSAGHFISAIAGGLIAAAVNWLSSGRTPHP